MSAFAGKQTFRTINSNVRLILKADVQVKVLLVSYRPKADIRNESIHGTFAVTLWNSPIMDGQIKIRLFSDNQG